MMIPTILSGTNIRNPGNGFFRIGAPYQFTPIQFGFSSITIQQPDPDVALAGTLTFISGKNKSQIDLATDRFHSLAGKLPFLDVTIAGVDAAADFTIILS